MPAAIFAGAAKRIITPEPRHGTCFLAGFDANRRATGVHDDLYARALALRVAPEDARPEQETTLVLVVCDLIGLARSEIAAIQGTVRDTASQQGAAPFALLVACTHTHSGPDTLGLWGPSRIRSGVDPHYMEWLRAQIVDAAAEALATLQPAQLHVGRGMLDEWLKNSLDPDIVDRELSIMQATTEDGTSIWTLLNLACHPEVLWNDNTLVSADYAGYACRALETRVGGTALFASADLGGMMTPEVPNHTFETAARMGEEVVEAALLALTQGTELAPSAIRIRQRAVRIPLENPIFKFALLARVLPNMGRDSRGQVETRVVLIDLGAVRLVTVPGELLPGPGLDLRQMLGVPYRFLIGLAEDELGYLIPSQRFDYPRNPFRPGRHYVETMSLSRYATPLLMEAWAALLRPHAGA